MPEPVSLQIIRALFDRMEWVNHRLLEGAGRLPPEEWQASSAFTTRDLRGTLVHELDVEWSWRLRLTGDPAEVWGSGRELQPEDYPTVPLLAARWARDEAELRAWLGSLTEADLAAPPATSTGAEARPLWQYLLHVITHSAQQQADAATLLTLTGRSPADIDFLDYVVDVES
jgi:uncharacterized damage-inducible protein DinB